MLNEKQFNYYAGFGKVLRIEENRILKTVLYMNLESTPRGRPRNRWQDEVREDGSWWRRVVRKSI
jgi:hypothetical protein